MKFKKRRVIMKTTFEVYYRDLIPETQKEILTFFNLISPEEGNLDINPLTVIYKGDIFDGK